MFSVEKYRMSFTTGGLLRRETVLVTRLFLEESDWQAVRERVLAENLLQLPAERSRCRVFSEIRGRLETLNSEELNFLTSVVFQDVDLTLWLALCRRYRFIAEFATEILRERFLTMKNYLNFADFSIFWEQKSYFHPELETIASSTYLRLRQMLFHFMRETHLIDQHGTILPVYFSPVLDSLLKRRKLTEVAYFPTIQKGVA